LGGRVEVALVGRVDDVADGSAFGVAVPRQVLPDRRVGDERDGAVEAVDLKHDDLLLYR
jgi:hypothetical protein